MALTSGRAGRAVPDGGRRGPRATYESYGAHQERGLDSPTYPTGW
ncbi:hypothetical protein [Streptomyces buecherae]|nr:hypothetical protein [Streptomyces buecherae]